MRIKASKTIPDIKFVKVDQFHDKRGYFLESYNIERYKGLEAKIDRTFIQDNISYNKEPGIIRGMHWQLPPYEQGKLVSVLKGRVLDIAVDIRVGSPTFGKCVTKVLSSHGLYEQMYIPPGFAHGFQVLEADTIFHYKCTNVYHPESARRFKWDSHSLPWANIDASVSMQDQISPSLEFLSQPENYAHNLFIYEEQQT